MRKSRDVLVRTSSTDWGVHFWSDWLRCARMAWLNSLAKAHREPGRLTGIMHFDLGSIFHALLAFHYSLPAAKRLEVDTSKLRYVTEAGPLDAELYTQAIFEAEGLYRAYRLFFQNEGFKVFAIEKEYEIEIEAGQKVTIGLDFGTKLGKRDLKRMGLDGPSGIYPWDHKTRGRDDPAEYELATHDPQFSTYARVLDEHFNGELGGFIVNLAYKGPRPRFSRLLIPKMALKAEWTVTKGMLKLAQQERDKALRLVESGGLPEARTTNCFKRTPVGWEFCRYYKDGSCDRKQHPGRLS